MYVYSTEVKSNNWKNRVRSHGGWHGGQCLVHANIGYENRPPASVKVASWCNTTSLCCGWEWEDTEHFLLGKDSTNIWKVLPCRAGSYQWTPIVREAMALLWVLGTMELCWKQSGNNHITEKAIEKRTLGYIG